MANHQNAATLGVALSLETGSFVTEANKVAYETQKLKNAIAREMKAADKEIQALKYATEDYGKAVSKVTQIERQLESGRLKDLKGSAKAKELLDQAAAYDKVANAARNAMGAQFKMNEQQKMQLTYQTTDLFTQIASGQSPFIAVIQQGGQLKDAMGGVGNALRAIGSLFTITNVLAGVFALGIGSVGYALYAARKEMDDFKDSMTLTGQYAGITYDKLVSLGDGLSKSVGTSIGKSREALAAVQSSGKFTEQTLESVTAVVLNFSKLSGLSASEAASKLIPSLDGTASSAKKLNEQYHFLTIEQYKQIKALEKQGDLQTAAKLTADALNESFTKTKRDLGLLEQSWKSITEFASQAWDAMLGIGRQAGGDRAKELETKINQMTIWLEQRKGKLSDNDLKSREAQLQAMRDELNQIVNRIHGEMDSAEKASKIAQKNERAIAEEEKYGEMLKNKAFEVQKAIIEGQFKLAEIGASEMEKLQLESARKIAEAQNEMRQNNLKEDGRATAQNLEIYKNKAIAIASETAEKIRQINSKDKIALSKAQVEEEQRLRNMNDDYAKMVATAEYETKEKTRSLELQKEEVDLKYQLIYASEKEVKLAEISLRYKRMRENIGAAGDVERENLDKQEKLEKFNVEIQESMKKTGQVFESVWGNLSSAIDNFVKTGKLNMKDFARSVIQDLIAIQMKAAALRFLNFAFTSLSGGGPTPYQPAAVMGMPGFANGGSPEVNRPSIVGERGPEIFVPRTAGTIIPNHALGGVGATTNVTNNYINAIDTKSFEDRLLGSSNAVWAANQYANKSLAVSRGRS